jgi:hypothetical protein
MQCIQSYRFLFFCSVSLPTHQELFLQTQSMLCLAALKLISNINAKFVAQTNLTTKDSTINYLLPGGTNSCLHTAHSLVTSCNLSYITNHASWKSELFLVQSGTKKHHILHLCLIWCTMFDTASWTCIIIFCLLTVVLTVNVYQYRQMF